MNTELLKKAQEKVGSVPILVNLVSMRERELINGAKPLVHPQSFDEEKVDLVLREIVEGKLTAQIDFDAIARAEDAKVKWSEKHVNVKSFYAS